VHSRIYEAQTALLGLLQASTPLARIAKGLGAPAKFEQDHVWVSGEVDEWQRDYRQSGLASMDEQFTLRVHVLVRRSGATYGEVLTRVRVLAEAVEDAVNADYTLGGAVMLATVQRGTIDEAAGGDGRSRAVLMTLHVRCDAHVA
jgi:hypothetical protein